MADGIYLVGGFTGWRKKFEQALPNVKFNNPLYHNQSSITRLNYDDMGSAANNTSLAYIEKGKRLGTMSYAELGAARAAGMPIIAVDENEIKDSILEQIATYKFNSKEEAYNFLNEDQELFSRYDKLQENDKTKSKENYKSILFTGDTKSLESIKVPKEKIIYFTKDYIDNLDDLANDVDIIIGNFDAEKKHSPEGLFLMGAGYKLKIPIIFVDGNQMLYPPIPGLARRTLDKENRFKELEFYLNELGSQHISDESLIYYKTMKKFNK